MTTHAERVEQAEREVVEAAVEYRNNYLRCGVVLGKVDDLLALRAATCPTCGGSGKGPRSEYAGCPGIVTPPCPAGCDSGRKRGE